jgi:hypothetical protein
MGIGLLEKAEDCFFEESFLVIARDHEEDGMAHRDALTIAKAVR